MIIIIIIILFFSQNNLRGGHKCYLHIYQSLEPRPQICRVGLSLTKCGHNHNQISHAQSYYVTLRVLFRNIPCELYVNIQNAYRKLLIYYCGRHVQSVYRRARQVQYSIIQ